jgi:L-threonylcarbamoyladenylate synthase
MQADIEKAIKIIQEGGIVIFPTDTAFGMGCRIDNENAVRRLFTLRKRPETQATPVLVSSFEMAQEYLEFIPEEVKGKLIGTYWPGALTIVLPSRIEKIPSLVRGGKDTLGVRMPNHPTALELIKGAGVPLLGPSANFHGEQTPYNLADLDGELIKLVDYIVPGECSVKQASTVIDCTVEPWKILRQGAVRIES